MIAGLRVALLTGASLLSVGCYTDCSSTVNSVDAEGVFRDTAGTQVGNVLVLAQQETNSQIPGPAARLSVYAFAPAASPLQGHVIGGRLVTESGETLLELPAAIIPPNTAYAFVSAQATLPSDQAFARVRDALLGRRTRVILDTDIGLTPRFEAPLSVTRWSPAGRRRCPYT